MTATTTILASQLGTGMEVYLDGSFRKVLEVTEDEGTIKARIEGFHTSFTFAPARELHLA